jgi:PHD/YefM family antitoxin component YafN of YafNO toxin-antitoxin module
MEKTISMSELRRDGERIAQDIERSGTVYRIRRPRKRSMLLVDADYFESQMATLEFIAQHPNWREELAEGDRQIAAGEIRELEDVMKELGLEVSSLTAKRGAPARGTAGRRKATRSRRAVHAPRRST